MKSIIIISIAFVLLIPTTVFAQESLDCPSDSYHGLDNSGNDACRDIETNKVVKTLPKSNTTSSSSSSDDNPISMFFNSLMKGLAKIFSFDSIEKTVESVSDSIEKTVESVSDSIPVKLDALSGTSESKLEDCSKYKKQVRDMDDVYFGIKKTQACEQRNKQITIKQGTQPSQTDYPSITLKMDNKPSGGATADFKINTVRVVDADYYKIININMQMTMHMKLQDRIYFSPTALWNLKSPDGEIYAEQCHGRQMDTMTITGKQNPNIAWDICYHIEKDLNKFDLLKSGTKIGTIILD